LLTTPKWEDNRWVVLANAFGSLCFIEVSLGVNIDVDFKDELRKGKDMSDVEVL